MQLHNQIALVTGAGQGIGRGIALGLAGAGADVVVFDVDAASAQAVAAEVSATGRRSLAVAGDVGSSADVDRALRETMAQFGRIDILVNNAAVSRRADIMDLTEDDWDRILRVNAKGTFLFLQRAAREMIPRRSGRIVNIASIAGKEGNPNAAHYSASKAGLIALTKSLGKELAAHDILVNAVTPAAAKTAIFDQLTQAHIDFMLSKIPKNRFVLVEELAAMVAWLASEDCAFSTGAVFDISGGRATY